jgi:hypothetical protein
MLLIASKIFCNSVQKLNFIPVLGEHSLFINVWVSNESQIKVVLAGPMTFTNFTDLKSCKGKLSFVETKPDRALHVDFSIKSAARLEFVDCTDK